MKLQAEHTDWMEERVEAYVDRSLPPHERALFESRLSEDPRWQESVTLSRRIRAELRGLETPPCPDEVVEAALVNVAARRGALRDGRSTAALQRGAGRSGSMASDRHPIAGIGRIGQAWKAAGSYPVWGVVVGILLVAAILVFRPGQNQDAAPPRQAEVDAAVADVKWTLAYLDGVSVRTGIVIREQVIAESVVRPIRTGLQMGLDRESAQAAVN